MADSTERRKNVQSSEEELVDALRKNMQYWGT